MVSANRFMPCQTQRHTELQPDCPVLVHCSKRWVETRSGTVFARVRLVNRTDREIGTVCLQIEGRKADGSTAFSIGGLVLADCGARPHSIFGEARMLALGRAQADLLRIRIEHVIFTDGMAWHDVPERPMTTAKAAHWRRCACGMVNPPEAAICALCGCSLSDEAAPQMPADLPGEAKAPAETEAEASDREQGPALMPDLFPVPYTSAPQSYTMSVPLVL